MHILLVRPVWLVYICIFRMPWNKICCPTMSFKKGNIREAYQVNLIPSVCKLLVCSCFFLCVKSLSPLSHNGLNRAKKWLSPNVPVSRLHRICDQFFWRSYQSWRIWVTFCVFTRRQWVRWLEGLSTDLPREGKFFPIVDPQQWNNVWLWWVAKTKTKTRNRQRKGQKTKTREKDKDKGKRQRQVWIPNNETAWHSGEFLVGSPARKKFSVSWSWISRFTEKSCYWSNGTCGSVLWRARQIDGQIVPKS